MECRERGAAPLRFLSRLPKFHRGSLIRHWLSLAPRFNGVLPIRTAIHDNNPGGAVEWPASDEEREPNHVVAAGGRVARISRPSPRPLQRCAA